MTKYGCYGQIRLPPKADKTADKLAEKATDKGRNERFELMSDY
jgi:hypothetical protein